MIAAQSSKVFWVLLTDLLTFIFSRLIDKEITCMGIDYLAPKHPPHQGFLVSGASQFSDAQ